MRAQEFEQTRTLYHTSRKSNRASIQAHGLEPRNQEYLNVERKPGVFMFETKAQAYEWAYWCAMTELEKIDVWQITVPRSYKLVRDKHEEMDIYNAVIGYVTIPPEQLALIKTQSVPRNSYNAPKRPPLIPSDITEEMLSEGSLHPVIVIDVQPEYSGMNDGNESAVFPEIIEFVALKQTGPVLMFVNAEDSGQTGDTVQGVQLYWEDTIREITDEYEADSVIDWSRFQIVDKGYGHFRTWMDSNVSPSIIIKVIRTLYANKVNDTRMLFGSEDDPGYEAAMQQLVGSEFQDWMLSDPIITEWTSISQLKKFSGAYIVGGGRNECLREVELLMNAFNIRYKRIDSLVY